MTTFITRLEPSGPGPRLAVKDNIDVAGAPTTNGMYCDRGRQDVVRKDAWCVSQLKRIGMQPIGKTNLNELAFGASGINPWYGTPVNPLDPARIPGGSSSGSAVAVADREADVALGTDTGGSVRIPAACCGVVGFKPTTGRVPTAGVSPLAPSLDAVGLLSRTVDDLRPAWRCLSGGAAEAQPARRVGRVLTAAEPHIEHAIDAALAAACVRAERVVIAHWDRAREATWLLQLSEAARQHGSLLTAGLPVGDDVRDGLRQALSVGPESVAKALCVRAEFDIEMTRLLGRHGLLVCPTLPTDPPTAGQASRHTLTRYTRPVNLLGLPAITVPVPGYRFPPGLQIIGARGADDLVLATARHIQAALNEAGG